MELTTEEISPYLGVHFMEKGKAAELHLYAIAAKLKRRVKAHFSKVEWLGVDSDRKGEALFLTFSSLKCTRLLGSRVLCQKRLR